MNLNHDTTPLLQDPTTAPIDDSTVEQFNDSTIQPSNDSVAERFHAPMLQRSDDSATFAGLARLSSAQYDRVRKAEARRLRIRIETLDAEVARCRADLGDDAQARAAKLPHVEPWPEPVDGQAVLDQVAGRFALYLALPPGAADTMALWTPQAHAFNAFPHTPRLNLSSPQPGCGKTTTLDVLATMVPRPLRTENLTAPVLFRLVHQHQPTLLLDEVDSYLTQAEELRGLLNAGHKRGACAYRCEGEGKAVRAFNAFAPAVLAGIGPLPGTLHDRSIVVVLLPADPAKLTARFDGLHTEIETVLCRKLARWTQDNFAALQACDPPLPVTAFNRVADNWRPLFAIAHIAGGDWPRRAIEAFTHLNPPRSTTGRVEFSRRSAPEADLSRRNGGETDLSRRNAVKAGSTISGAGSPACPHQPSTLRSVATPVLRSGSATEGGEDGSTQDHQLLLADIRQIFAQSGATRMSSKQLLAALHALPRFSVRALHSLSARGGECQGEVAPCSSSNEPSTPQLSTSFLARSLRPHGITSRLMRIGTMVAKGYALTDFTDAFARHLKS